MRESLMINNAARVRPRFLLPTLIFSSRLRLDSVSMSACRHGSGVGPASGRALAPKLPPAMGDHHRRRGEQQSKQHIGAMETIELKHKMRDVERREDTKTSCCVQVKEHQQRRLLRRGGHFSCHPHHVAQIVPLLAQPPVPPLQVTLPHRLHCHQCLQSLDAVGCRALLRLVKQPAKQQEAAGKAGCLKSASYQRQCLTTRQAGKQPSVAARRAATHKKAGTLLLNGNKLQEQVQTQRQSGGSSSLNLH